MITIRVKTMDSNEFNIKVKNPYKVRDSTGKENQDANGSGASAAADVKVTSIKEAIKNKI